MVSRWSAARQYFETIDHCQVLCFGFEQQAEILRALILRYTHDLRRGIALDVASGIGLFAYLANELLPDLRYFLLDESHQPLLDSVLHANSRVQGDGQNLPFKTSSIDLLLCRQGLHYMELPKALLEFRRVLAPEGLSILSSEWWWDGDETENEIQWKTRIANSRNRPPCYLLSRQQILEEIKSAGFQVLHRSDNYTTSSIPLSEWSTLFGTLDRELSAERAYLAENPPPSAVARGYHMVKAGMITTVSKWIVVVCQLAK